MRKYSGFSNINKLIIAAMVVVSLFSISYAAFGAGYLTDSVIQGMTGSNSPHVGYANSTNKCKACHAVHQASGSYKLLRANTASTQCTYCHGVGVGIIGTKAKINGASTEGHTIGYIGTAPDDSDPPYTVSGPTGLQCNSCHSPHGASTTIFSGAASSKLLKRDPDPGEALFWTAPATGSYQSTWCSDCHSANYGTSSMAKTVGGSQVYGHGAYKGNSLNWQHDVLGQNMYACWQCHTPDDFPTLPAERRGQQCYFCHKSSGYPHSQGGGTSRDMLTDSFNSTSLDDICLDCHLSVSLP